MTTASSIPLLHVWGAGPVATARGLFAIGTGTEIPNGWEPNPGEYEPQAVPTPFARAEATRLVLARVEEAHDHYLFDQFRWLLLGVASGVLQVEPADLGDPAYDNLGPALRQVDPEARYFCRVLWPGNGNMMMGASYRSCLFWGHARRAKLEWDNLARMVRPLEAQAKTLLADWRESLRLAGRWEPHQALWQRGIDYVLGQTVFSEGLSDLADDSTMRGPIWLELPTGQVDPPLRVEPVFFPTLAPGFAASFVELCKLKPSVGEAAVELRDARGTLLGAIRMPGAGAQADGLAIGMGLLDLAGPDVARVPSVQQKIWVMGEGGLRQVLRPLEQALGHWGRSVTDPAQILACPFLYPDPLRILAARGLWVGSGPQPTGRAAYQLGAAGVPIPTGDGAGIEAAVADFGTEDSPLQLILVDRAGGLVVLDLRALGYVLWKVFVGEAELVPGLGGNMGDAESYEPLLIHSPEHPFEATSLCYEFVSTELPVDVPLRRRLATLQRFVASYVAKQQPSETDRVLERAAQSFARWASGLSQVAALGHPGQRTFSYTLPLGTSLDLAVDA